MITERKRIEDLFTDLCNKPVRLFPKERERLSAPSDSGVYIIRKGDTVLHVGRTVRGKEGIRQRLKNHLHGSPSFTNKYLKGNGAVLRDGEHTYKFIVVEYARDRALLEAYAIGILCPKHIGLGE